jgi:hypothetical protein
MTPSTHRAARAPHHSTAGAPSCAGFTEAGARCAVERPHRIPDERTIRDPADQAGHTWEPLWAVRVGRGARRAAPATDDLMAVTAGRDRHLALGLITHGGDDEELAAEVGRAPRRDPAPLSPFQGDVGGGCSWAAGRRAQQHAVRRIAAQAIPVGGRTLISRVVSGDLGGSSAQEAQLRRDFRLTAGRDRHQHLPDKASERVGGVSGACSAFVTRREPARTEIETSGDSAERRATSLFGLTAGLALACALVLAGTFSAEAQDSVSWGEGVTFDVHLVPKDGPGHVADLVGVNRMTFGVGEVTQAVLSIEGLTVTVTVLSRAGHGARPHVGGRARRVSGSARVGRHRGRRHRDNPHFPALRHGDGVTGNG